MAASSHDILLNSDKVRCRRIDIGLHSVLFDFANCHVEAVLASPLASLPGNESVVGIETADGIGGTVVFRISERQRAAFRLRRLRPEEEWTERHNGCPRSSLFPFWDDRPSAKTEGPMKSDDGLGKKSTAASDSRAALEALHADIRQIKEATAPLPAAIAKVDKTVETVHKHVRGVPILQAELAEAKLVPESLAVEIHNRIADILDPEEQAIWHAMRKAGGSQKDALVLLKQSGIVKSPATLSRRVRAINPKLLANNLPVCDAPAPAVRFTKHGGYVGKDGDEVPEELSVVEPDWAKDPAERDTTIQSYLAVSPEDKDYFHQTKPGIQEEADKYLKRRRRN